MNKIFLSLYALCLFLCVLNSLEGSEKMRIIFIINPISHEIKDLDVEEIIKKNLDLNQYEYKITYAQYPQHAGQLAQEALKDFDMIAAVGGDGTVNQVGRTLVNTDATLAIIPVGSGNGLARHLGIPVGLVPAIQVLNYSHPILMDTAKINGVTFLNVAGIGFDAHVAHKFAELGKRGNSSYSKVAAKEFSNYKSQLYTITIDGKQINRKAFILSFANSSQYGNNYIIAPKARVSDGFLDLALVDNIPMYYVPSFMYKFKHGTLDSSSHFETYPFKEIVIRHPRMQAHIDGEPILFENEIKVTVEPKSLKILVP